MSAKSEGNKIAVTNAGAIAPLVYLLRFGEPSVQQQAAGALGSLAVVSQDEVAEQGAIPPLIQLLRQDAFPTTAPRQM